MFRVSLFLVCHAASAFAGADDNSVKLFRRGPKPIGDAGGQSAPPVATPTPTRDRPAATQITLEQAITMALANSPSIKAARTQIQQNQAQEITANLRPNPTLAWDSQFIPVFSGDFSTDTLNNLQQFDIGLGYLFERGHKRQNRLQAARDTTAVTAAQVADTERTLVFNVAQQFINVLLANSTLQFAQEALRSFQETVNISAAALSSRRHQ